MTWKFNPFTEEFDYYEGGPDRTEWGQNGFENTTDSTLTWTDSTPDRTLSIQPAVTNFSYYQAGVKYTSTGDTVQITDTEGIHVIYYDGDTLTAQATPTTAQTDTIIRTKAIASIVYWDATNSTAIYVGEERHGMGMSPITHAYLHFTEGLRYLSGLGLNTIAADEDGSDNAHAQFGTDAGAVSDEDLYHSLSAVTSTTGLPIYYLDGAAGNLRKMTNAGFSVETSDGTSATRLTWNEFTGGAWTLTEVTNNDFVLCHVFATTEKDNPVVAFVGQAEYANKGAARTGAETEILSLVTNDILFPEFRALGTVIFECKDGYTNDVNARIATTDEGDDYIDWRSTTISRVEVSTTDHGSLSGLGDDDHTDYHTDARALTWLNSKSVDEVSDVDTTTDAPERDECLKWNGTNFVPAAYDYTFEFSIASFSDGQGTTSVLIGDSGDDWAAIGALTFTASYNNGPPTNADVDISGAGAAWSSPLALENDGAGPTTNIEAVKYPASNGGAVTYTLTANVNGDEDTATDGASKRFYNYFKYDDVSKNNGFADADITALVGSVISNDTTRTITQSIGASNYLVIAHRTGDTNIAQVRCGTGDNQITVAMDRTDDTTVTPLKETVSHTNTAGKTENFYVYASKEQNLDAHSSSFTTLSSSTIQNYIYFGGSTTASSYSEADVEGLDDKEATTDSTQTWDEIALDASEYYIFAMPSRFSTPTFYDNDTGFEAAFEDPETVSVTNACGFKEDYKVFRSENILGPGNFTLRTE